MFDDALRLLMDAAVPIEGIDRVPLTEADGRVAARDVVAGVDVPPFDRAAMDGYAVVAEDTFGAGPHAPKNARPRRPRVHRPDASAHARARRVH